MNIVVSRSKCNGSVVIPASKSDLHRALIASALAKGKSVINNISLSIDISTTIGVLKLLGAKIEVKEDKIFVEGIKEFKTASHELEFNESGSSLRFLIPLLGLYNQRFILKGKESLLNRPLSVYKDLYNEQNLVFNLKKETLEIDGKLRAGEYLIPGNISSQFISGLLFYLPLLENDSIIKIKEGLESKSYIDMTINTLSKFNVIIDKVNDYEYRIKGNQKYEACNYEVEGNHSQFAFFATLGAINNDITCFNLKKDSLQGDQKILHILKSFNVDYFFNKKSIMIYKSNELKGNYIDLNDCIDLGPIVMVLSLFSLTPVKIINVNRLKIKESNRLEGMINNLRKVNAKIISLDNEIIIYPSKLKSPKVILDSYNDHRIMMALIVLGTMLKKGLKINNFEVIKKSYPNFYLDLQKVGIDIGLNS